MHARRSLTHALLPSGARFFPFLWERFPLKLKQLKEGALFSHGHWASEHRKTSMKGRTSSDVAPEWVCLFPGFALTGQTHLGQYEIPTKSIWEGKGGGDQL